ncbi:MAG: Acyl-CoA synthetase (AMP-forming)/AMP-acid ligase [Acidimicrobiales bacterium]|nr:Acyl-CoA synthetase (AMP-forming)/AMP-acid ligase [Acidimicrobiales bacterium]
MTDGAGRLLTDQLRLMAAALGDEVAATDLDAGADLTFADWERRSNRMARWLVARGVAPGERVALHLPPAESTAFLVSYAAVHKAGAVAVPTSTRLVARELAEILDHAGAVVAVTGGATAAALLEARPKLPTLHTVVATGPIGAGVVLFDDAADPDDGEIQVPVGADDIADLMYTSGTTGRPKGVVVRHRSASMLPNGVPRWTGAGWLHASPLFTFAGISSVYNPMKLGMRILYLPRFDADRWLGFVESHRPTAVFLVPAMVELLVGSPRFDGADLSSITMCSVGSAPIGPATLQRLRERLPEASVSNAWGMTEAGPAYCLLPKEQQAARPGSVGKPLPPTEFRIVDDEGQELAPGEVGELLVRNPGREREYFNAPAATAATWRDGWLLSGDDAYLDADGYLYVVGRRKDVIIRGGNNVHAGDVEAVLYEHPAVSQAAVTGVPHAVLGEDVAAWVVLHPHAEVDAGTLIAFCAERLSDYKVPRHVTFVDELPRNATGKVVKRDLRLPDAGPNGAGAARGAGRRGRGS